MKRLPIIFFSRSINEKYLHKTDRNRISPVINFYDTVYFLKILNSKRDLILHQTLADSTRGRRFSRGFVLITVNRNKETRNKGNISSV